MIHNPGRRGMKLAGKAKRDAIAAGTLSTVPRQRRGVRRPCPYHCRTSVLALPLLAGGSILLDARERKVGAARAELAPAAAYALTTRARGLLSTHVVPVDVEHPPTTGYRRHECPNEPGR